MNPTSATPRRTLGSLAGIACATLIVIVGGASPLARAADPYLNVYCAPGTAPTCFGVSLATAPDGAGGTEVTLRLSNLQGASGFPITLPTSQPAWSRLYRVDIQGPDDGTFAADNAMTGVALSLAGGATSVGDTSMTWGVVPLEIETGVSRGFAVGTDITTSGAEIVGCSAPPDLGYPSITTCAANGAQPEVMLQFATRTAWTASQVTLTLLFQDPTGEYACLVSEAKGTTAQPLRCERVGGVVTPPTKQAQSVAFSTTPPSPSYVAGTYAIAANASSGLAPTLVSATPAACALSGASVTFVAAGACTITADQAGNDAFLPAPQAVQSFLIVKRPQAIAFTLPASGTVGSNVPLIATGGGSGSPVTFASTTPATCSVAGATLSLIGEGTCQVVSAQDGSAAFEAAVPVAATLTVTATTSPWAFTGFLWPVENLPDVNTIVAGEPVPFRFSLGGNRGPNIFAPNSPRSSQIACTGDGTVGSSTKARSLGNLPAVYVPLTGRYVYVWVTAREWAGTCRIFTMDFADGSSHSARFDFRPNRPR